jgi:hypothetical protein
MATDKKYCSICAWRQTCQKKFSIPTDASGSVLCPDFTRDVSIRDEDIENTEKAWQED